MFLAFWSCNYKVLVVHLITNLIIQILSFSASLNQSPKLTFRWANLATRRTPQKGRHKAFALPFLLFIPFPFGFVLGALLFAA